MQHIVSNGALNCVLCALYPCFPVILCALMCPMTLSQLIGTNEAARLLGVTRSTVNRHVASGIITPAGELGRRGIRVFDRAYIEELARTEKPGTHEVQL